MELTSEVSENHTSGLMASLKDMLDNEFVCDFTIKVGEKSFAVHRVILAGTSKYFKAMFSSEMKEAKEGFVQMVDMEESAVEISIEFMYTGKADIDSHNVEGTLSAATLMQLDGLAQLCFHFLENTIDVHTCLRAVRLSDLYGRDDVKVTAEKFLTEHIEDVTSEPDFPTISKENLTRYITASEASHEVSWRAVVAWLADDFDSKVSVFPELISFLKIQEYNYELMQKAVLSDSILLESEELTALVATQWLSDIKAFKKHLTSRNYYSVKSFVAKYTTSDGKELDQHLGQFFPENLEKLSMAEEFLQCNEDEILPVFQDTKNQYFSEKVKWEAALKWVKHDEGRQEVFPVLFSTIKLHLLHHEFVQNSILSESLVRESHECKDALLCNVYGKKEPASQITWLNQSSQEITSLDPSNKRCNTFSDMNDGIGIASVLGNLFLATRNNLFRLNRDGTWTSLPSPPQDITSSSIVLAFKDCVYILNTDGMQWFCPVTNRWSQRLDSTGGTFGTHWAMHEGACAIGTGDTLYAFGGTALHNNKGVFGRFLKGKEAFKLASNRSAWSTIAPMTVERAHAAAVELKGSIWVMGGGNKSVEVYHPASNIWARISEMVFTREKFACCIIENRLFVVGGACNPPSSGFSFGGEPLAIARDGQSVLEGDSIEMFDETSAKWKVIQTLGKPAWNVSCCPFPELPCEIAPLPKRESTPHSSGLFSEKTTASERPFSFGTVGSNSGFGSTSAGRFTLGGSG